MLPKYVQYSRPRTSPVTRRHTLLAENSGSYCLVVCQLVVHGARSRISAGISVTVWLLIIIIIICLCGKCCGRQSRDAQRVLLYIQWR